LHVKQSIDSVQSKKDIYHPVVKMRDIPPQDPRPARPSSPSAPVDRWLLTLSIEPKGKTLLQYSPNGEKLIVAGLANFVRTYNTGDEENVVIVDNVPDETNAVIAGVSMAKSMIQNAGSNTRTG